jgi:acetyltransferase-like isoleucine patch superfamily enzyme
MRKRKELFADAAKSGIAVRLGEGAIIDDGVVLGYLPSSNGVCTGELVIGPNARVRCGSVLYRGTSIGRNLDTGHNVLIRERNIIGDSFRIWANSTVDYGCKIGSNVKIHVNVYIAQFTIIEDGVFIGPGVILTNDIHPGCPDSLECMRGPVIKKGAQIGANSCVLPRVTIGEYSIIGAGSVVTRDIPARSVAYGNPARAMGKIGEIVCTTGRRQKPYSHLIGGAESENTLR